MLTQNEIVTFLASCHPFELLPVEALEKLARVIEQRSISTGQMVLDLGQENQQLYIIHSGQIEIRSATGKIFGRIGPGQAFGIRALLGGSRSTYRAVAIEDGSVLKVPKAEFLQLNDIHPQFERYFEPVGIERVGLTPMGDSPSAAPADHALPSAGLDLMVLTARDMMTKDPVSVTPAQTANAAARIMRDRRISCVPVVENDEIVGIVTDADFRDRVVAEGCACDVTIGQIMTQRPLTLGPDALAFDALAAMMQRKISHVPVVAGRRLVGILTQTDLIRAQSRSAVYMIGEIGRRPDVRSIADIVADVPKLLVSLVSSGATAHKIGHIISSITDATTNRLITLAEDRLGPAPIPYLWLACGSQGRQEQTGVSDQDNCLILADSYSEKEHGAYFKAFAQFVCDGLNEAGYVYCPGDMMAITDKWRQPLSVWRRYFRKWISEPEPMAQMLASVMFDLRPIRGDESLYRALLDETLPFARSNSIFLAHMLSNSLTHQPPIGFFGNISVPRIGEHKGEIDMKHGGVVPVVDLARLYALEASIPEVNTHRRLEAGRKASVLSEEGARDLLDAFEFIANTRLRHQAAQIREGKKPNNYLSLAEISHFERNHLRDAFTVVKTLQSALSSAHQVGAR
ncbi:MAG: cyclic nucleotide-binding/CBS domain-containing protein [Hyphomicrobiaceae bacterium]|nr:cyclic nucleotide-binding/CBS domain-containing protein [Hyphomicrobiaceae bacterium]